MDRCLKVAFAAACLLAVSLSGCSDADGGEAGDGGTGEAVSDGGGWTVLVYSIADTDLEPFLMADVVEMAGVGSTGGLQIEALVDRAVGYSDDDLLNLPNWEGGKLLSVEQGELTEEEDLGDVDTGDPQVLADFIARGIEEHPADHYALILTDHGASWPGVGGDESSESDLLDIADLAAGISSGLEQGGIEKLDLLGFDACLMANYEVATALAPYAERLLASQENEPGHGWDYRALQLLVDEPDATVDDLGSALIDGFEAQAKEQETGAEITLALIDLNQMGAVDDALNAFTTALVERSAELGPIVGQSRADNLGFGSNRDPEQDVQVTDLGMLASRIGIDALDVSEEADALTRAINDAVVDSVAGPVKKKATGLSVYFPPERDLLAPDYASVTTDGGWSDFLESYYGAGDEIPADAMAAFLDPDVEAETSFDEDGLNLFGTIDPASLDNVAEAYVIYGTDQEDGSVLYFGDEPAVVSNDGSGAVSGTYDLTQLVLSDGEDEALAYVALSVDEETGLASIDVPMVYHPDGDVTSDTHLDISLSLTYDPESGEIVSETYYVYDEELSTVGELTADPEAIIVPELLSVAADGTETWIPTTDVGLYADLPNIQYSFPTLASGTTLYAQLTIVDFGGNLANLEATVVTP